MLTIGIDAHKRIHVAVALDEGGQEVAIWKGPNSAQGWTALLAWAKAQGGECQFGIEGAWGLGRGLAQHLVSEGERVYEINARWTAQGRRRARNQEKTDRLDARAIAAFLKAEAERMAPIYPDDDTSVLELLSTERDSAVAESTRIRNQLHAHLMQLDPEYSKVVPTLRSAAGLGAIKAYTVSDDNPLRQERAAVVRRLALRLELALNQAEEMAGRIRSLAAPRFAPLTRLCGVNLLTAGALAGILGPGKRFATEAELAAFAGVSPLEASSAGRTRHRLNRTGNRRLNAVLYRIAITQAHHSPEARAYLARRVSEGKTRREAFRALKRYLARAIFRLWAECQRDDPVPHAPRATCGCT
jgi:transposase